MNKKLKIVSSVALAGLLALNVFSPKTLAAEVADSVKTTPLKAYHKLVPNKSVVPFVLVNANDVVTVKEVVNNPEFTKVTKFNGASIPNENTLVATGDTFVADGKEYTVVVYGDVDKNGRVNGNDALLVQEAAAKMKTLDAIQLEAADVKNEEAVNGNDALRIREFAARLSASVIDKVHPEEDVNVNSNYTVTVSEDNKLGADAEKATITVKLAKPVSEDVDLYTVIRDSEGETTPEIDLGTITTNLIYIDVENIDLSKLADGIAKGTLYTKNEANAKVELATYTFDINKTDEPKAAEVSTLRVDSSNAEFSLKAMGDSDITKVYYMVTKTTVPEKTDFENAIKDYDDEEGKLTIVNGDVKEAVTMEIINVSKNTVDKEKITDLEANTPYTIYYMLENSYGTRTYGTTTKVGIKKAAVESDKTATPLVEVLKPSTLSGSEAIFTFVKDDDRIKENESKYRVTVYKDNVPVAEKEIGTDETNVDIATMLDSIEDGVYKVSVVVLGKDEKANDSKATVSESITISALAKVTNVVFSLDTKNGNRTLTWKDTTNKASDVSEYSVKLINLTDGSEVIYDSVNTKNPAVDKTNKKVVFTETQLEPGKRYKAEVTAIAKTGQMAKVNSEEVSSDEFFVIGDATLESIPQKTTADSIMLHLSTPVTIDGKTTSYSLSIYKFDSEAEELGGTPYVPVSGKQDMKIEFSKIDEISNAYVVSNLDSNSKYAFKLTAKIDGFKGESRKLAETTTLPVISGLTYSTDVDDKGKNVLVYADDILYINENDEIAVNTIAENTTLAYLVAILDKKSAIVPGDKVTLNGEKLSVLVKQAETSRTLEAKVTDKLTIEFIGNGNATTLKGENSDAEKLILSGNNAQFITDLKTDDDEVLAATLPANSTVMINNLTVSTTKETIILVDNNDGDLTIYYDKENANNDLTFKNKSGNNVEIAFVGESVVTDKFTGKITIIANSTVTLTPTNVEINSALEITVSEGVIDLTNVALSGTKNVTISRNGKATILANVDSKLEFVDELDKKEFKIKNYSTDDDDTKYLNGVLNKNADSTESIENLTKINAYIAQFGLVGKVNEDSKIQFDKISDSKIQVTIKVNKAVEEATIKCIK